MSEPIKESAAATPQEAARREGGRARHAALRRVASWIQRIPAAQRVVARFRTRASMALAHFTRITNDGAYSAHRRRPRRDPGEPGEVGSDPSTATR